MSTNATGGNLASVAGVASVMAALRATDATASAAFGIEARTADSAVHDLRRIAAGSVLMVPSQQSQFVIGAPTVSHAFVQRLMANTLNIGIFLDVGTDTVLKGISEGKWRDLQKLGKSAPVSPDDLKKLLDMGDATTQMNYVIGECKTLVETARQNAITYITVYYANLAEALSRLESLNHDHPFDLSADLFGPAVSGGSGLMWALGKGATGTAGGVINVLSSLFGGGGGAIKTLPELRAAAGKARDADLDSIRGEIDNQLDMLRKLPLEHANDYSCAEWVNFYRAYSTRLAVKYPNPPSADEMYYQMLASIIRKNDWPIHYDTRKKSWINNPAGLEFFQMGPGHANMMGLDAYDMAHELDAQFPNGPPA